MKTAIVNLYLPDLVKNASRYWTIDLSTVFLDLLSAVFHKCWNNFLRIHLPIISAAVMVLLL